MNVERRPGGAYEILPGGVRGPLVWRNRGGRRELTAHGRATLGNFQDMLLWVPVFEQQFDTGLRAYDPMPRRTWYPLSADTFEGLLLELQSGWRWARGWAWRWAWRWDWRWAWRWDGGLEQLDQPAQQRHLP